MTGRKTSVAKEKKSDDRAETALMAARITTSLTQQSDAKLAQQAATRQLGMDKYIEKRDRLAAEKGDSEQNTIPGQTAAPAPKLTLKLKVTTGKEKPGQLAREQNTPLLNQPVPKYLGHNAAAQKTPTQVTASFVSIPRAQKQDLAHKTTLTERNPSGGEGSEEAASGSKKT